MKPTLYIRYAEDADRVEWLSLSVESRRRGVAALDELAVEAEGRRLVVFVPAGEVLLASARLPTRKRQRMLQALPYALEEQLASDVENLHFALGDDQPDGSVVAAVIERARVAEWVERLHAAGLEPYALVPESAAVPMHDDGWTLLLEPDRSVLRRSAAAVVALEAIAPEALLELALADSDEPPAIIHVHDCRDGVDPVTLPDGIELQNLPCPDGPLGVLASGAAGSVSVNLLQGEFSRREAATRRWRQWKPAAALAAVILLVQGGLALERLWQLESETERLSAALEQQYREAFPEARRVVDARAQMEQQLKTLRSAGGEEGLAALLGRAGPVLKQVSGVAIRGLRYRDGRLELDLSLGDLQALDRLKQQLVSERLAVEIVSASQRGGQVESRLTIEEARA